MGYRSVRHTTVGFLIAVSALLALFAMRNRLITDATDDADLDRDVTKLIAEFNLRPLEVRRFGADPKFKLGQALFFDPILSGPRDVACATCHLLSYGTSDGLPRSIGVHGVGLGSERRLTKGRHEHPRNALDLWNRDNNAVRSLFWDGRVEVLDSERRLFRSPLGKDLPRGLDNALAVQALFPLVTADEMLGDKHDRSSLSLPNDHAGMSNDLVGSDRPASEPFRIKDSHARLMTRLLGTHSPAEWQQKYRKLFHEAYPRREDFTIVDVANALAHFEEMAFATRDSAWDRYLRGNVRALRSDAKRGAVVFYGKGRCGVCHSGPLFSDFDYYAIGVFDAAASASSFEIFGRWNATRREEDRYKFRTPPLRNVTKTAPYFHNGSEPSLKEAIELHFEALERADKYNPDGSFAMSIRQINAVSPILFPRPQISRKELDYVMAFLSALDYQPTDLETLVPKAVPSGLPIEYK